MAYDPSQYAGKTYDFGDQGFLDPLKQEYGFTDQQIQGLRGGQAGQATPELALGNTGYRLTMGAGGGSYTILPQRDGGAAPSSLAPSNPASAAPAAAQPTGPVAGGVPQGIGMTAMTPQVTGGPTVQTQFRDALLGQLQTNPNDVKLTDPDLAPQARAYENAQQRSQERMQQQLAEQGFAAGALGTGAYGQEIRHAEQQRGESEAAFEAQLLADAKQQRLESLFEALGLGQGQITADEGLRVQKELGQGDLSIRGQDVANDYALGQGQLSLGLLQAMLQDRQANNRLGYDIGSYSADLNYRSANPFLK